MKQTQPRPKKRFSILLIIGGIVILLGWLMPNWLNQPNASPTSQLIDPSSSTTPPTVGIQAAIVSIVKMVAGIIVISSICIGIARWMNRRQKTDNSTVSEQQILASVALDSRCMVHLVQLGQRRMLIGMDLGGVKSMLELPPIETTNSSTSTPTRQSATNMVDRPADEVLAMFARVRV